MAFNAWRKSGSCRDESSFGKYRISRWRRVSLASDVAGDDITQVQAAKAVCSNANEDFNLAMEELLIALTPYRTNCNDWNLRKLSLISSYISWVLHMSIPSPSNKNQYGSSSWFERIQDKFTCFSKLLLELPPSGFRRHDTFEDTVCQKLPLLFKPTPNPERLLLSSTSFNLLLVPTGLDLPMRMDFTRGCWVVSALN